MNSVPIDLMRQDEDVWSAIQRIKGEVGVIDSVRLAHQIAIDGWRNEGLQLKDTVSTSDRAKIKRALQEDSKQAYDTTYWANLRECSLRAQLAERLVMQQNLRSKVVVVDTPELPPKD